jgi:tetratricopeptide (TPR) repeat protein
MEPAVFSLPRPSGVLLAVAIAMCAGTGEARAQATASDVAARERRLADAVAKTPDSLAAQLAIGEFYLQAGKAAAAIPHLERAHAIDGAHRGAGYALGVSYLEAGRLDAARALVRRLLQVSETAEVLHLAGDIAARRGDFVDAAEPYQRAARLDPTEEHLFDWGDNLLQLRAPKDAVSVFTPAIRRYPASARLHVGLGIAQYALGQHEAAVRAFCAAADLAPSDPRAYAFLGEMYGVSPELSAEVTTRLARFVELQPRHAGAHFYYAMSLWKGDGGGTGTPDLVRVEALLQRAATLDPKHAGARLQLGILLSEQRRWPEAIRALRAAIALDPKLAQAHFRLATAYRRTGQTPLADQALAQFEKLK